MDLEKKAGGWRKIVKNISIAIVENTGYYSSLYLVSDAYNSNPPWWVGAIYAPIGGWVLGETVSRVVFNKSLYQLLTEEPKKEIIEEGEEENVH